MKKLFLLAILCISIGFSFGQNVPQGMKYQAVARNTSGNIIANQSISIKINLVTQQENVTTIYYSESHTLTTNALGLFTLTIGEGKGEAGAFSNIPWSTSEIWMQVAIKEKGNYVVISNSKLLAVPYAFHSGTSGAVTGITQSAIIKEGDACDCKEGLKSVQILYLGSNSATIKVFEDKDLKKELFTFSGKNNGDILLLSATARDRKLPNKIYFQVNNSSTITEMRSSCNDAILGETFGNFSVIAQTDVKTEAVCNVCDVKKDWKVGGNVVLAACNTLGSKNKTDLIIITDNTERMRVRTDGDIIVTNPTQSTTKDNGALVVEGGVGIEKNLNVGGKVNFGGDAQFGGKLHITDLTQSTTTATGALVVDGGTGIGKNLNVGGTTTVAGATTLGSTLEVTSATHLKNTLQTDGPATLGSTLAVTGATHLKSTLLTDGATTINNSLTVTKNDGGFVANITNTNDGDGDGIYIKLGKAKSDYTPPALPTISAAETGEFKDLILCNKNIDEKLLSLLNMIKDDAIETGKVIAGVAVGAGNMIIKAINDGLGLPLQIGPFATPSIHIWDKLTLFGGLDLGPLGKIPELAVPALTIPSVSIPGFSAPIVVMPELPKIDLSGIGIPSIDIGSLEFWSIPNICLEDNEPTPLNNKNEFIRFADKNDSKMGSIKAASVSDWSKNYLNPIFLFTLRGALLSSKIDKLHARYHFQTEIFKALENYSKLGVEYSSGNGDYAEWLPRIDITETINAGDIVGVVGGKVTKQLKDAEQVMVVSHNPIILGNIPAEGKNYEGNNIAFMGQVPVKILGPVTTGDYIVGQSNTPGYGIAKHQNKMTIEDFKNTVGRSWVTDESEGPKMVNTVVGVHNNNFINIIKDLKQSTESNDARLKAIENKLNMPVLIKSKVSKQPLK